MNDNEGIKSGCIKLDISACHLYDFENNTNQVSDVKGDLNGFVQSDCAENCPAACKSWESYISADDPWTGDPSLKNICAREKYHIYNLNI